MRSIRILSAATLIACSAVSANAGGLAPSAPAAPVHVTIEPAPSAVSPSLLGPIIGGVVILGLLAWVTSDCDPCAK